MVRLEKHCGVKLLHLYCRHHIYERIVNDVCKVVLGNSESPETSVHKRLRDNWLNLNVDDQEPFQSLHRSVQVDAKEFIAFASNKLCSDQLKGDYKEVLKLALFLLAAYPSDLKAPTVNSIGAISHARWMAKIICELHIALYSSQLVNLKVIDKAEANNHRNLALFLVLYYLPNWIECPLPFEASRLDLSLYQKLLTIKNQRNMPCGFANLAAAMMNGMEAHFWYLSE